LKVIRTLWRVSARLFLLLLLALAMSALGAAYYVHMHTRTLPEVNTQYLTTHEPSEIVDSDGSIIWTSPQNHTITMDFEEIPELYIEALLTIEDKEFWTTPGYSLTGIANAVYTTIASRFDESITPRGGSTLEQQLIKNTYFNGGIGISTTTRKIQEIYLARQLNANFSKEEILTFYVNHLSYAEGATGIAGVMSVYFDKTPEDYNERTVANIAEIAYMVGLNQNPTTYNAYTQPENAEKRKNDVLYVMWQNGIITEDEYRDGLDYVISDHIQERHARNQRIHKSNLRYKHYTDEVLREIRSLGYDIETVTMRVNTFLDQATHDSITETVRQDKYYPDGSVREQQVAVSVIDSDGIVRALIGSRHADDELNRATQRTRSSGSALKQFTAYAPLFEYLGHHYSTASLISSEPYRYPGTNLTMNNWGGFTYGNADLQTALRRSMNTPVARIADDILGPSRMKTFLHSVGLDHQESYSALDAIGLYVSTLDSAAALNALNNNGIYTAPRFVNSIEFTDGSVREIEPQQHRAMNASTAWVINQMLRGVVTDGYTAQDAKIDHYDGYAGKTGTVGLDSRSNSPNVYGTGGSDSWFNTYTNGGYSISIWYGYDIPNESPQVAEHFPGIKHMGRDLQLQLNGNRAVPNWDRPPNVETIRGSGLNAHYRVTDSSDLGHTQVINVPEMSEHLANYADLETAKEAKVADGDWLDKRSEHEQKVHQYIQDHPEWKSQLDVINRDFYNLLLEGGSDE